MRLAWLQRGIDLRSLPYSFLAPDRAGRASCLTLSDPVGDKPRATENLSRVIGRPEFFKPYARLLNCDASGLATLELPKRAAPALIKELERTKSPLVYRWRREENKILSGEALSAR